MPEATETPARTTAWIDKRLQEMAKKIGSFEGKTIAEVMEAELWRTLPKRLRKALDKEHAELGEAGA